MLINKKISDSISLKVVDSVFALLIMYNALGYPFNGISWYLSNLWHHGYLFDYLTYGGICGLPLVLSTYFKPPLFFQLATAISFSIIMVALSILSGVFFDTIGMIILCMVLTPCWYVGWIASLRFAISKKPKSRNEVLFKAVVLPWITVAPPVLFFTLFK